MKKFMSVVALLVISGSFLSAYGKGPAKGATPRGAGIGGTVREEAQGQRFVEDKGLGETVRETASNKTRIMEHKRIREQKKEQKKEQRREHQKTNNKTGGKVDPKETNVPL